MLIEFQEAGECLKKILSGTILDESLNITQLGNLNVSNDNSPNVDQVLRSILIEVESFW